MSEKFGQVLQIRAIITNWGITVIDLKTKLPRKLDKQTVSGFAKTPIRTFLLQEQVRYSRKPSKGFKLIRLPASGSQATDWKRMPVKFLCKTFRNFHVLLACFSQMIKESPSVSASVPVLQCFQGVEKGYIGNEWVNGIVFK